LRNSNKQHLILTKFYVDNAPFIDTQSTEFQLSLRLLMQFYAVSGLWGWRQTWNWSVLGWPDKNRCSYCLL